MNLKSQKGVTLVSIAVYIVVLTVVLGTLSVTSQYFFKNTKDELANLNPLLEYTKFNSFFTDEVNHENIKVLECKENYIVFDNGIQYTFVAGNEGVYRNKVKICEYVKSCTFRNTIQNGKDIVEVNIQIGNSNAKRTEYTLRK